MCRLFVSLVFLFCTLAGIYVTAAETPNIVLLVADDMGYGEPQCFSSASKVKTPNLNAMAAEGMKLTRFYGCPACSASRGSLLTGTYNARIGIPGALSPSSTIGLNPSEITLAEIAKQRGYKTAIYGKWHVGHRKKFLPTQQGFDEYWGLPFSVDQTIDKKHPYFADNCYFREGYTAVTALVPSGSKVPLMENDLTVEFPAEQPILTQRYTAKAVQFITDHQAEPFFLYLPYSAPHAPLSSSPEWTGTSVTGPRGDAIQELDASVGTIIQTLKDLGIDNDTLVWFMSDNGAPSSGLSGPFTGVKATALEGGVRVPSIVRWPGRIPAGTTYSETTANIDVLPTFVSLLNTEPPNVTLDGANILPCLLGTPGAIGREVQLHYSSSTPKAMSKGKWKIFLPEVNQTNCKLFDLSVALPERIDVAGLYPDLVASLKAEFLARDLEIKTNSRPVGVATTLEP